MVVLRHPLALATLALLLFATSAASASVIRCWGKMRNLDCSETDQLWDADSHPTFGGACEGCGYWPDGGGCVPISAGPQGLGLSVEGKGYGSDHFEALSTTCGGERLFRYTGPLHPGRPHEISFPGNVDYSRPVRFTLSFSVDDAPVVDAGAAPVDAGDDAAALVPSADAGSDASIRKDRVLAPGCSYAPRGQQSSLALGALAGILLSLRRRFVRRNWPAER
jgi:hypothetical protein